MIWYLLYPFRGTTEGPVLEESHPLRIAFARYGRYAASHVVTTLLVSVAVASVLIYPFPFLYTTDFTSGASILPEHAWTDTLPLVDKNRVEPDVIMRSIWVHGNYFQALNRNVLRSALDLQDELLGPTVNFNPRRYIADEIDNANATNTDLTLDQRDSYHVANGLTNQSWFFQSPLQYWSCSSETIEQDDDIIATANERKTQSTSVNVTLRHSTVFSGKRFQDRRLVAADALVITLVHHRDSPVGRQWQEKVQALKQNTDDNWDIFNYSPNGKTSEMYEFQFRPMSSQDVLLLGLAYTLVLIYFLTSLSKLRAVKSKVGLMVTVIAQIVLAIFSSFTICAIFKIDLSRIPRLGYPVVIFSMSLENIFRLINAVILTPSEHNTSKRIGYAFGETGFVALTSVAQNLIILYGLSKLVSPGVSAFCTFTAIALIFDFFYLSTFFLSVLSVDVRRTELSDALAKASIRSHRSVSDPQSRQTWLDAMLQGRIAMSTRIAGTIVMVGFVLISQWHFFENESVIRALSRILHISPKYKNLSLSSSLSEVHQGRSPASWLGLQDHETARELIHVIKPDAHSYIARVFYPTIFVLKGSDRNLSANEPWFPPAVYDFIRHQSSPFIVTIIVIAAAVRLLMNYLLWDELADSARIDGADNDPLLSVKTLSRGHTLDVALLTASSDGHLVSIGLDRIIRVWDVKAGGESYVLSDNDDSSHIPFPILAVCIDDESHWLALLTSSKVLLWNLVNFRWGPVLEVERDRHKPEAFFFVPDDSATIPSLVVIRRDGTLTELRTDQARPKSVMLTEGSSIVSVSSLAEKGFPAQVIASTRDGQVHIATQEDNKWPSSIVNEGSSTERDLISIQSLPELGFFLVIRFQTVDLVDSQTLKTIYTFNTDPIQPKSVKCFHSRPRKMRCGSIALWSFTMAYNHAYTRDLMVHTYSPQNEGESLCFCDPTSPTRKTCCPWQRAKVSKRTIKNPGVWDALPSGIIAGVRKKTSEKARADGHDDPQRLQQLSNLRRRHQPSQSANGHGIPDNNWEVWMFSHFGKKETWETQPLCPKIEDDGHLFVNNLGPMARIGRASLAIGLSNVIKVIVVGNERFETGDRAQPEDGMPALGNRRRKGPSTLRAKHAVHCPHC
ncbi:sterol-sensing domain of SREBP cleavage-activation-domain-containing protein [Annulohypoxylon maeteangense]|uniref:sterol-sensing domain of SREBP cleavage-activation-domain-containing protein n=1 Tax=Annulohypoxylon maeteangense TaxID=1927788 RepID=UPI00200799BB|nr:sterol-sensing domain of SREBP cleavage-activation-domain-containing protein [Annulohypoxylon maeteangense]KAI0883255.1 sterol-sensing domain of SREBP cleavage-activation-domain-containing protein [Annulohypoxylon maeteangense]